MIKRHKDINFSFETEKDHSFSFYSFLFIEKKINVQQVSPKKIRSVV